MTEEWSYNLSKNYWKNPDELKLELSEKVQVRDVDIVAMKLRTFLEKEKLPFQVLGKIKIFFGDKKADANLKEHWTKAFVIIPIMKKSLLSNRRCDKCDSKYYLKVRINLGSSEIETWQEKKWNETRWYLEMAQIKAWKDILEKFGQTLPSLKTNSDTGNPSVR